VTIAVKVPETAGICAVTLQQSYYIAANIIHIQRRVMQKCKDPRGSGRLPSLQRSFQPEKLPLVYLLILPFAEFLFKKPASSAADVKGKYLRATGDETPVITVSTANPYKFCGAVLDSIGMTTGSDTESIAGVELIDILREATGLPAPRQIAELKSLEVRFGGSIEKEKMQDCVLRFIR
jgi:hypothetical protein